MSLVSSMRSSRNSQRDHSHRIMPSQGSEENLPSEFKIAAAYTSGRRHRGFRRSEVKKSAETFLLGTINSHNFEAPSTINSSTKLANDLISNSPERSLNQALDSCDLTHTQSMTPRHKLKCIYTGSPSETSNQPSQARLAAMDAIRSKLDTIKPSEDMKAHHSETSSLDIIVDNSAGQQESTDQKKSCWLRGVGAAEQTAPTWDNSGHDVENLGPMHLTISLNNLPKRLPRESPLTNASRATTSSFNGMLARGTLCGNDVKPRPTSVVTPKELQRTDVNFPSLPLSQNHPQESKALAYKSFPFTRLVTSTSSIHRAGSNKTVDVHISPKSKLFINKGRVAGKLDPSVGKMVTIEVAPEATVAPYLGPKPRAVEHKINKEAENSTLLHSQQTSEIVDIPLKPDVKIYPANLPPLLIDAWNKSTLITSGKGRDDESAIRQHGSTPSVSIESQTTILVPVKDEQKFVVRKAPQQDTLADLNKSLFGSSSTQSKKEHECSLQDLPKIKATQDTVRVKSHSVQASNSKLGLKKAENPVTPVRESVSAKPALPTVSSPNSFEDGDKVRVTNGMPEIENRSPQQCAPRTGNAASDQYNGLSRHTSASARSIKFRDTPTKDDSSPFTWISGIEHTGLQGWDKKMKPAPIGEEWTMRDAHDSVGAKHKAVIETWASDQLEGQAGTSLEIDVNSPEFLTGQVIINDDMGIRQGIEASLHDAIPDRTTLHEPKRQMNTEDTIREHIALHGLPSPGEPPIKHEKRNPVSGETKAERRARLEFARAAERSLKLEPNEHTPKANIYMRPAEFKDIPMITDLHDSFIANQSVATHFVKPSDESVWRETLEACLADCCPFFVAIISQSQARAMQVKDVRRGKFESVVGFAYGTDFGAPDNAYRITLEIEIWVDPRHKHEGIGKTLLDRMLACLDPMYAWKDPVPFLDMGDRWKWMGGGHRTIQTLIVSMLYSNDEKEALEWKKAWLMRSNFQMGGVIPNIARKSRKQINLCQMYYTTGHDVSHIFQ